jgi:hypothetical protein
VLLLSILPAGAMQNFCDSRFYPTARSPIESARRAVSIAHLFAVQRGFSTLISWSGSSSIALALQHKIFMQVC